MKIHLARNNWLFGQKLSLTVLEEVRLAVSTLDSALSQPHRPLFDGFALSGLLQLFFLFLHADDHVLGVQVSIG